MKLEMPELHKLVFDLPSSHYHGIAGTYSSSQFKDLLDDEEVFIKKYILKTIDREEIDAFDIGNYFHTGILEPEKLAADCVVFPGKIRRGAKWEKFKKRNKNRVILTSQMMEKAEGLIKSVEDSPIAMGYVRRGKPEVSLFIELRVWRGDIYAPKYGKMLTRFGWVDGKIPKEELKNSIKIIVKVRADSLGDDFILDLKSTTGNARSESAMKDKVKYYNYDLSAALYLDLFNLPMQGALKEFIWTFASKDYLNSRTYRASEKNIYVGRRKYMKGIFSFVECKRNDFQLFDALGVLEPHYSDRHYLDESEMDL